MADTPSAWEGEIALFGFLLSKTGLRPQPGVDQTFDQYAELGDYLRFMEGSIDWLIGDYVRLGESMFSERAAQAVDATNWDLDTVKQKVWVAEKVPTENRRADLSWSHHRAVAKAPVDQQAHLLEQAATEKWPVRRLAAAVKETEAPADADPTCWLLVSCANQADRDTLISQMQTAGRGTRIP